MSGAKSWLISRLSQVSHRKAMKRRKFNVGIYTIEMTVYKTGNVWIRFVDRITGNERILIAKNPLVSSPKRAEGSAYRI